MQKMGRSRSGLQSDVISLFRSLLRSVRDKENVVQLRSHINEKFRQDAPSVRRSDFKKIEFLLRQGHKRLKQLKLPGTKVVTIYNSSTPSSSTHILRRFSSVSSLSSLKKGNWEVDSRPRAHIISLGCGRNWVDSEVMLGNFLRAGYEIETIDAASANLLVVNTCGFLQAARDEGDEEIDRVIKVKLDRAQQGLPTTIVVTGCMVNLNKEAVLDKHPEIDHLIGASGIGEVLAVVEAKQRTYAIPSSNHKARSHLEEDSIFASSLASGEPPPARLLATPPHLAYLKIAEGCRKRCTFCIIPLIKGPLRSKSIAQVSREFKALSAGGVREVSLIAQDLGDFGKDARQPPINESPEWSYESLEDVPESKVSTAVGQTDKLVELLIELTSQHCQTPPATWLRLLYLYPDEVSSKLLALMKHNAVLPYLDMPMQHVSSRVLQRMGRKVKYDRAALEKTIHLINNTETATTPCGVAYSPWADEVTGRGGVTIRTTLMVGFPGETEADFQELLSFLKGPLGQSLTHIGVFTFSPEPKARASKFQDQVEESVKQRRARQIESVHSRNLRRRHQSLVTSGRDIVVLIDHVASERVVGRHPGQALGVDGIVMMLFDNQFDDQNVAVGQLVVAQVVGLDGINLIAKFNRVLDENTILK